MPFRRVSETLSELATLQRLWTGPVCPAKTEIEMYLSTNEARFRDVANAWPCLQFPATRGFDKQEPGFDCSIQLVAM